jgi:cytochrome bd-type quinol oxidase subunit 2
MVGNPLPLLGSSRRATGRPWLAAAAAVLAFLGDGFYLWIIAAQGNPGPLDARVVFVASFIGVGALAALLGVAGDAVRRASWSRIACGMFGSIVLVGAMSIGPLFIPSLVLSIVAARASDRLHPAMTVFSILLGPIVMVAGLAATASS